MELYVIAGLCASECMPVKSPGLRCNQLSPVPEIDSAFVLDRTKCDPTKTKADKPA